MPIGGIFGYELLEIQRRKLIVDEVDVVASFDHFMAGWSVLCFESFQEISFINSILPSFTIF
jgi:hypothetical protein